MSAEADYLRGEADNVRQTLALVDDLVTRSSRSQYETIALGKLLQDVYSGIERILRTLLERREVRLPKGADWHKSLLLTAHQQQVITEDEFASLRKLLLFRHVQIHGYGFMLEEERLLEIARTAHEASRALLDRLA
jgi:hypothetical protein